MSLPEPRFADILTRSQLQIEAACERLGTAMAAARQAVKAPPDSVSPMADPFASSSFEARGLGTIGATVAWLDRWRYPHDIPVA